MDAHALTTARVHASTPPIRNLLRTALPVAEEIDGMSWRFQGRELREVLARIGQLVKMPAAIDSETILQQRFSTVFRFDRQAEQADPLVVKLFPLPTWKHQLKHRRYAIQEGINLACAAARGLQVPQVVAVGWLRRWGRVRSCVMCMRYIDRRTISQNLSDCDDPTVRRRLIWRAMPSLIRLYQAGCNHTDFGPHAVMIRDDDPASDVVIDFERTVFLPRPNARVLAAQAGYYAWALTTRTKRATADTLREWFSELLQRCELSSTADLWEIWQQYVTARPSSRERMKVR